MTKKNVPWISIYFQICTTLGKKRKKENKICIDEANNRNSQTFPTIIS